MSPSQRTMPSKVDTNKVLLSRGLAIVLKKSVPVCNDSRNSSRKKKGRQRKEPAEDQRCKGCEEISDYEFGPEVFADWTKENEECYWNPCLVQSVKNLEYKGFVRPTTLLVGGTDYSLEVVRSAWGRRMLRPPNGYDIVMLGDLDPITMNLVAQTQFAPLPEALCKVVYDLTSEGIIASMPVISKRLKTAFPEIMLPSDDILYKTLGTLIRERKLYHTGSGYSVVTPDTFRLLAMSTPLERPMLLTNEEALVRLHGVATDNGTTACTQTKQDMLTTWSSAERIVEPRKQGASLGKLKRCHSLKLLRSRDKEKLSRSNSFKSSGTSPGPNMDFRNDIENIDAVKKEKPSMFSKLFRRGRSEKKRTKSKGTSSSTQFPPRDWADPDYVLFNSRATQTLDRNEEQRMKSHTRSSSLNRNSSKERHSIHLSSTPATPRIVHRNSNRHQQCTDIYHYRSSSLTRKASSSPKREYRQSTMENTVPRVNNVYNGVSTRNQEQPKPRPRYESPFSPFPVREKTQSILTASDKYATVPNETKKHHGSVSPYQSTDILKSPPVADKLSSFSTPSPFEKKDISPGWRRPSSLLSTSTIPNSTFSSSFKSPPQRVLPRFSALPREISTVTPPKPIPSPQTTTKIISEDFKTSETVTKTFPRNGKELRLGTTVDVEISVNNNVNSQNNKKSLLTTDLDSPVKNNDLLTIATTWNHSIKSNSVKASEDFKKSNTGIPKLTATTNITTSLSHGAAKDLRNKVETTTNTFLKSTPLIKRASAIDCSNGRDSPSKDTICSSSPRSTLTADAKSEFFSDSPNTTAEVHLSKDDSGFSSSASTSRPMSVSPC